MGLWGKLKFGWDSVGTVVKLIEQWSPKGCKSEKDFEKSLYAFLHEELLDIQVTKQFAQGRTRADIVVGDSIIVELKYNLDATSKYQRLLGQLESYAEWKGAVIILLTGETEPNLRKELDKAIEKHVEFGPTLFTQRNRFMVFQK